MELYAIVFSVPMSFIMSITYGFIIGKITTKWSFLIVPVLWISCMVLIFLIAEFFGVFIVGVIKLREVIGTSYYSIHSFLFFFTLPSLVNIMRLQTRIRFLSKWYVMGSICAFFGLCIVVLQYYVFEILYGIDGMGGPYSHDLINSLSGV